jgi:hypothetical protein
VFESAGPVKLQKKKIKKTDNRSGPRFFEKGPPKKSTCCESLTHCIESVVESVKTFFSGRKGPA